MERDEIAEHLNKWTKGKKQFPYMAELRLTRRCNLNCFHCPDRLREIKDKPDFSKELKLNSWLQIVNECSKLGVKVCHVFASGEPFIRREIAISVIRKIKEYGMMGKTITNGTLFTHSIIEELVKIGWDEIMVSLDGPTAKIHDYIRGKGVFSKATRALKLFTSLKRKAGKGISDPPHLLINTIVTNLTFNKLSDIVLLAHRLGVEGINFQPLGIYTPTGGKLKCTKKQIDKLPIYVREAKKISEKYEGNISGNIEIFLNRGWAENASKMGDKIRHEKINKDYPLLVSSPCYLPWYFISIKPDGRVHPCHNCQDKVESIHNKSLKEIWFGEHFSNFRKKVLTKKLPEWCSGCCAMQAADHLILKKVLMEEVN